MNPDAFIHLPELRHKVTPPEQSQLRVTPEVLQMWDERARQLGRPPHWRLPDHELENTRRACLGTRDAQQDLWIFGYGSLLWDPGFHFVEVRLAALAGYQRRFAYRTVMGRGTPERPALVLSLEPCEGECHGLAFRIASDAVDAESAIVWRREMIRGGYCPTLLPVQTPQGSVAALVFAPNTSHPDHVGECSLAETAATIAGASGVLGSNLQYLEQLAQQLDRLGIDDPYVQLLLTQARALAPAA